MHQTGETKIKMGNTIAGFLRISEKDAINLLQIEPDEKILTMSFGRLVKSFVSIPDSNIYVTNKRVAVLTGNKLSNVWYEHVKSVTLLPSTFWETLWVQNKYDSIILKYYGNNGDEQLRYWCSNGVIGHGFKPLNDRTKQIFDILKEHTNK